MRLSEAILAGSVLVKRWSQFNVHYLETSCALGMADRAMGFSDDMTALGRLVETWPWLSEHTPAPFCNCYSHKTMFLYTIAHLFDYHVHPDGRAMPRMSLEQLVDWVRSVEPAEPSSEDVNAVRLPEVSGNELSGERTQNTLSSDRQLSHK